MASSNTGFFSVSDADGYLRLKTALLVFGVVAWSAATRPWQPAEGIELSIDTERAVEGEEITVTVRGPKGTQGSVRGGTESFGSLSWADFTIGEKGAATLHLVPPLTGNLRLFATTGDGQTASRPVTLLVQSGVRIPGTSVFVLGPKPGSDVDTDLYVRGRAKPGTTVVISSKRTESVMAKADSRGDWGGMVSLKPGPEVIKVKSRESEATAEIPVTVH